MKDIRTGELPAEWPTGTELVESGGIAYFRAYDRIHGTELWKTDGTAPGTALVRDICPGVCSSSPFELTAVGSSIFFRADDGAHGPSLWKSDGTKAGTVLVKAVEPAHLAEVNGMVAFAASSEAQGEELWRSDGTAAGTIPLGDLRQGTGGSSPKPIGRLGGLLLFQADDGVQGRELWKTDGTAAGTAFVADLNPGSDSAFPVQTSLRGSAAAGGLLFFRTDSPAQLWASDGTPSGTARAGTVLPQTNGELSIVALGGSVYFPGSGGLWKSDGSEGGTALVKSIPGSYLFELAVVGGRLFFRGEGDFLPAPSFWSSDGTEAGTGQVPLPPGLQIGEHFSSFLASGNELLFFAGDSAHGVEPWKTDGTEAGTIALGDVYPGSSSSFSSEPGLVLNGIWLFRADTPDGWELWASDGTAASAHLVKRIDQSDASGLEQYVADSYRFPVKADLAGSLLFSADSGSPETELWRSDGTEAGTSLVKEMVYPIAELTSFGGRVFFSSSQLWSSDGSEAGTVSYVTNYAHDLTPAGAQLYFATSGLGDEIRKIGSSDSDTTLVIFLYPGLMDQLTAVDSRLFFRASGANRFWTSDGTEAGTQSIPGVSNPDELTAHRGTLIFSASDGATGQELWISDGTEAGSHRIKDILPGTGSSKPREVTSAGALAFFIADDGVAGDELWKSDGTAAGTARVADIRPGPEASWIREITALGDRAFFAADDGVHGVELWVSDGTAAGTRMVQDAAPGAASSYPRYLTAAGHLLLFAAEDGTHGLEPWKSDGTEGRTGMIYDVAPGEAPSTPTGFTLSGGFLYFTANDGAHGFELWALDRSHLGAFLTARKRVISPAFENGSVVWEVILTNEGAGPQVDAVGDELVDVIPAPLALVSAAADIGTATVSLAQNRVAWNGSLSPGQSATLTIVASVPSATEGSTFFNQATLSFDSDGDGTNESAGISDDPARAGSGQPTPVVISTPPLDFYTVTPCRVFDTRSSTPLASGTVRTFAVAATCGIPAAAKAVAANLTAVGATGPGRIVVYPAGRATPTTSNINFKAGESRANNALIEMASGQVDALATVIGGGTVELILDVTGYYQ